MILEARILTKNSPKFLRAIISLPKSRSPKAGHNIAGRSEFRNQRFKPDTVYNKNPSQISADWLGQVFDSSDCRLEVPSTVDAVGKSTVLVGRHCQHQWFEAVLADAVHRITSVSRSSHPLNQTPTSHLKGERKEPKEAIFGWMPHRHPGVIRAIRNLTQALETLTASQPGHLSLGRHLVGVWIGGVRNGHFPESEKYGGSFFTYSWSCFAYS